MNEEIPKEVLEAFTSYEPDLPDHSAGKIIVEKISGGLINHSYKVCCELKPDFFLQKINKNVFASPGNVQENYVQLWKYAEFEFTGLRLPSPKYCGKNSTIYIDKQENYWRAFEFIEESKTTNKAVTPAQAKATARAFAKFTAAYEEMNIHKLKSVIPGFHNLSLRYQQFEEALSGQLYERMAKALVIINELKQREKYKQLFESIIQSPEFPQRVMHHDAKIANVLFHKKTGKVICPVDYDTVMPGYFFSDLGDLIRSMACSEDENSTDFDNIGIQKNFYEAIIAGYIEVMGNFFTEAEKKYIHYSGLLIIYMQALRFITDYLNGDIYYQISYREEYLNKAKNQFILLQQLEEFLKKEYDFSIG